MYIQAKKFMGRARANCWVERARNLVSPSPYSHLFVSQVPKYS